MKAGRSPREIVPEPSWKALSEEFVGRSGTALVLGAADVGKSALSMFLIRECLSRGLPASLVDSDIGQSTLGLPGTISMKRFEDAGDLEDFRPDEVFFVGSFSPARKFSAMVEGTARMAEAARAGGPGAVVVDTTGLVGGEVGRNLKKAKIKALRPDYVAAIQRGEELEHILSQISGPRLHRLRPSPLARRRSAQERAKYRRERFRLYLRGSRVVALRRSAMELFSDGRPLKADAAPEPGTLVGLNSGERTLALGIFLGGLPEEVLIRTPLRHLKSVDRVLVGDVAISGI
jgi:polynucleotide 5'-hydroxyl-kinase GRC3/NOL9